MNLKEYSQYSYSAFRHLKANCLDNETSDALDICAIATSCYIILGFQMGKNL